MNTSPLFGVFLAIFIFTWTCSNFFTPPVNQEVLPNNNSYSVISDEVAADGLDLKGIPSILAETKTAEEFEKKLNEPNGINNLDLNNDQVVDYINVKEIKNSNNDIYGFQLTTEVEPDQIQDIATIEIQKNNDQVSVNTYGNNNIYGANTGYTSTFPLGTFFLMSYFLSPHSLFSSPYRYGNYPSSYSPYNNVSQNDYFNRAKKYESKNFSANNSKPTFKSSPNSASSGIKKSLKNPTTSQKSFRARELNRSVQSGGFGRKANNKKSSFFGNNQSRARSFSSSKRGFGGFGK